MKCSTTTPFDSIEAAQEYLALLSDTVAENRQRIEAGLLEPTSQHSARFLEVLKLGSYNLQRLENHLRASRQTLGNLRKLQSLILNHHANENNPVEGPADLRCSHDAATERSAA